MDWSRLNPLTWPSRVKNGLSKDLKAIGLNGPTPGDEAKMARLNQVGERGLDLSDQARGSYGHFTGRAMDSLNDLQGLARGQNSVSMEQLRQGNQQALAAQRSMAAGASPNNAAMAARQAATNMGRLSAGLSGQQAVAGLQERNQAMQNYASLLGGLRGQDAQLTLGGLNAASGAYGGGLNGQKDPTIAGQLAPIIGGFSSFLGK